MKQKTQLYTLTIIDKQSKSDTIFSKITFREAERILNERYIFTNYQNFTSPTDIKGYTADKYRFNIEKTVAVDKPLIEPTDTWSPRRRHTRELFEGYFRAKYGKVPDFMEMFNAGIDILRNARQPVYIEYLENFMKMMIKKHHSDIIIDESCQPRFFQVTTVIEGENSELTDIMPFAEVMNYWPHLTAIIEKPDFHHIFIENSEHESLRIKKYNKLSITDKE